MPMCRRDQLNKVADNVDRFTLDKEEKAQLIAEINKAQLEVNKVEAGHTSMFVAGWRPFVGWTCGIQRWKHQQCCVFIP